MTQYLVVALLPPDSICDELGSLCTGLPQADWADIQSVYLPLFISGNVRSDDDAERIKQALSEVEAEPLRLRFSGIRYSKKGHGGGELSVPIAENEALDSLRQRIQSKLNTFNHERRKLPHTPRVPLARLHKGSDQRLAEYMQQYASFQSQPFFIHAVYLLNLSTDGEKPRLLARISLGASTTEEEPTAPSFELPSYWRRAWLSNPRDRK